MNLDHAVRNIGSMGSVRSVGPWLLKPWIRHDELVRVWQ